MTDDEPVGKKTNSSSPLLNGKRHKTAGLNESLLIDTIIGRIKLPQKPTPPKFEPPSGITLKSLPGKLKIEANFEGVSNMKLVWSFATVGQDSSKNADRAECASYELYVCTIRKNDSIDSKRLWQRIGKL